MDWELYRSKPGRYPFYRGTKVGLHGRTPSTIRASDNEHISATYLAYIKPSGGPRSVAAIICRCRNASEPLVTISAPAQDLEGPDHPSTSGQRDLQWIPLIKHPANQQLDRCCGCCVLLQRVQIRAFWPKFQPKSKLFCPDLQHNVTTTYGHATTCKTLDYVWIALSYLSMAISIVVVVLQKCRMLVF